MADALLESFQKEYKLPSGHLDYLRKEVEDMFENSKTPPQKELENLRTQLSRLDYHLVKKIGSGAFGNVYEGRRLRDGVVIAIKVIDLEDTKDDIGTITREINALVNGQSCPQLTNYYGSHVYGTKLWILMEFIDGGSILDKVKTAPLDEKQCAIVCREVLSGLKFLLQEGKIHRDIKAANILVTNAGQVKLADFGATAQLTNTVTKCNTFIGSPYWMAPEILTENKYDGKADIWSLGITCIEMATGKVPLQSLHPLKVIREIPRQPSPKLPETFSEEFRTFVDKCLNKNPAQRPTVQELLKLPFIENARETKLLT